MTGVRPHVGRERHDITSLAADEFRGAQRVNGWLINEGFAALIRSATALCVLGAFSHQDTAVIAHEMNRSRWAWRLESIVLD